MTKEEFEELILLNKITAEQYENRQLNKDIIFYYDFKVYVSIVSKALHVSYDKQIFFKKRIAEIIESVDKVKNLIYDKDIEFKFLTKVKRGDLDYIFEKCKTEQGRHLFLGVIRRLYNYQEYTNLSVRDILSRVDELDYVFIVEKKDKFRFDIWCENHPNVNIEEERAKRTTK